MSWSIFFYKIGNVRYAFEAKSKIQELSEFWFMANFLARAGHCRKRKRARLYYASMLDHSSGLSCTEECAHARALNGLQSVSTILRAGLGPGPIEGFSEAAAGLSGLGGLLRLVFLKRLLFGGHLH